MCQKRNSFIYSCLHYFQEFIFIHPTRNVDNNFPHGFSVFECKHFRENPEKNYKFQLQRARNFQLQTVAIA